MFVFNDMTRDVRVQREAATLAAAGHDVTVVARPRDVRSNVGDREESDGFTIRRVPVPGAWRRPWSIAMLPARAWSAARRRLSRSTGASMPSTRLARPIDHLVKWRFAVLGWNRRAAAAAPPADAYHGHD